jgi:hypothetical protein
MASVVVAGAGKTVIWYATFPVFSGVETDIIDKLVDY